MGRFAEAQKEMDRTLELDPLTRYIQLGAVIPVLFAGRYDQAIEQMRRIVSLNLDFSNAHLNLGSAYAYKGTYEEAIASLREARSLNEWPVTLAALGYANARAGRREEAQELLGELQDFSKSSPGMTACAQTRGLPTCCGAWASHGKL